MTFLANTSRRPYTTTSACIVLSQPCLPIFNLEVALFPDRCLCPSITLSTPDFHFFTQDGGIELLSIMSSFDIRARAQDCIDQFQTLLLIKEDINSAEDAGGNLYDVGWVEEQLARFKMWAGNIGAFAEAHASLDYRLRDSEETRRYMLDFLFSLRSFVQSGND